MDVRSHFADNHGMHFGRGDEVHELPRGSFEVDHHGNRFFVHNGEFFRRHGGGFVVVAAPIGAFVPLLPLWYSTVWWDGVPYYYADDTYYTWDTDQQQYEVVEPPSGIESGGMIQQAPAPGTIFVYPKNGQSSQQQQVDRYECHRSAADQTGYDPMVASGGVPPGSIEAKRADYVRAETGCLEARGYSVE
jgi:hypothetical protein